MRSSRTSRLLKVALTSATLLSSTAAAWADADDRLDDNDGQLPLPTGQFLTPTAATGSTFQPLNPQNPEYPNLLPSGAIASALSPDGRTLLVMTGLYNRVLWEGLRGNAPYPAARSGIDLRHTGGTTLPH